MLCWKVHHWNYCYESLQSQPAICISYWNMVLHMFTWHSVFSPAISLVFQCAVLLSMKEYVPPTGPRGWHCVIHFPAVCRGQSKLFFRSSFCFVIHVEPETSLLHISNVARCLPTGVPPSTCFWFLCDLDSSGLF